MTRRPRGLGAWEPPEDGARTHEVRSDHLGDNHALDLGGNGDVQGAPAVWTSASKKPTDARSLPPWNEVSLLIIIILLLTITIVIRPRHLVSPTLRGGGRGGRALAGLSPPPRPPLHLFRSPSPTHGQSSSYLFFSLTIPGLIRITPRHLPPSYRPRHPSPSHRPFPPSPLHR